MGPGAWSSGLSLADVSSERSYDGLCTGEMWLLTSQVQVVLRSVPTVDPAPIPAQPAQMQPEVGAKVIVLVIVLDGYVKVSVIVSAGCGVRVHEE